VSCGVCLFVLALFFLPSFSLGGPHRLCCDAICMSPQNALASLPSSFCVSKHSGASARRMLGFRPRWRCVLRSALPTSLAHIPACCSWHNILFHVTQPFTAFRAVHLPATNCTIWSISTCRALLPTLCGVVLGLVSPPPPCHSSTSLFLAMFPAFCFVFVFVLRHNPCTGASTCERQCHPRPFPWPRSRVG